MDSQAIVSLISDLGSLGFILYLVHRTTTHTIPRLAETYVQAEKAMRSDFREALREQRADFLGAIQKQRDDFREEMTREREIHGAHVDRLIDEIRRSA